MFKDNTILDSGVMLLRPEIFCSELRTLEMLTREPMVFTIGFQIHHVLLLVHRLILVDSLVGLGRLSVERLILLLVRSRMSEHLFRTPHSVPLVKCFKVSFHG